jgi:hypothetical protein
MAMVYTARINEYVYDSATTKGPEEKVEADSGETKAKVVQGTRKSPPKKNEDVETK